MSRIVDGGRTIERECRECGKLDNIGDTCEKCGASETCRTCGHFYAEGGDGFDDECPECADRSSCDGCGEAINEYGICTVCSFDNTPEARTLRESLGLGKDRA